MKYFRTLFIVGSSLVLVACGGHGFEGEYKFASSGKNNLFGDLAQQMVGEQTIIIGDDFMEVDGSRDTYDEIFVRESGSKKYLVLSAEDNEEIWQIVNENTLMQDAGFVKITIKKI
jgi:hypothetical protein